MTIFCKKNLLLVVSIVFVFVAFTAPAASAKAGFEVRSIS